MLSGHWFPPHSACGLPSSVIYNFCDIVLFYSLQFRFLLHNAYLFRETMVGGRCCLDIGFRHTVPAAYPCEFCEAFHIFFDI